jgi:hypothetical protein
MVPPSLFGFPIVIDNAPQGVIHSFFVVPVIPQAPPGYKDDYQFLSATDSFPVCATVLGNVAFKTADLDRLLNKALMADVAITLTDVSSEEPPPYPFSVPLPVAAFLHPPIGHDSGAVLLETLGAAMCRQKDGIEGFVSNFNTTLAAAEPEATDEGKDASAKSNRPKRKSSSGGSADSATAGDDMAPSTWAPSLEERLDAFFSLLTVHLQDLWNEERDADEVGIRSLPWPKSAAALGKDMSIRCVRDLMMSFGLPPPATKSAWQSFTALAQLEDVLENSGFPDFPPEAYTNRSYSSKVRFVEKCVIAGSNKKRRTDLPPGIGPRDGAGGGSGTGAYGGPRLTGYSDFMGWKPAGPSGSNPPAPQGSGGGIDIGRHSSDPDQMRRDETEREGFLSQLEANNRKQAMALLGQTMQGGGSGQAMYDQVQSQLVSDQTQLRLSVGLNPDGSGNYDLTKAPSSVRKAVITNTGDAKRKLGYGMEGGALAPGAMANLVDTIQSGMGSEGFSLTTECCKNIVMCKLHLLHPRSFIPVGFGHCTIGKAKSYTLQSLTTFIPSGIEMLNLMNGIIAARALFDSKSSLIGKDLEAMKLRLEKANRSNVTVLSSWQALRASFQSYSQAITSWARSPQALTEPSLLANTNATDFLWAKAHQGALLNDGVDPAWTGFGATSSDMHGKLSSMSPAERKTLMFNLQKLERPASPRHPGASNPASASAPGDGKVKTKGDALWPKHIRSPCAQYVAGEACEVGAQCRRFCYATKGRACFIN